ncbi:MAG: MBL fold metallo-hydrolase [Bacteroidales bacterium]|nr:MBL fold metallo-hydrolase [Bacteroidales bacterium]
MYEIHEIKGHIQSIYLIVYKDKILLMDCATRADLTKIKNFVENKLNRKMHDIKLAVVSHMHPDHAGLAKILQSKYKIPILAHPAATKWYSGFGGNLQHIIDVFLAWYVSIKQKNPPRRMWYSVKFKIDFQAKHGEKLPFFNDWQAVFTPGHTSHDISLYHPKTKVIYLGDVLLKVKNKYVLPMPVTLPGKMQNSLTKLSQMKINKVMLAHGGIMQTNNIQSFLKPIRSTLDNQNQKMPAFIRRVSFFSPCIKNIENCIEK